MKKQPAQELELTSQHGQVVVKHQAQPLALDNPVQAVTSMLQAVVEKGITQENVGAMEKLVDLFERMQNKQAEQAYNKAFTELQAETPAVQAKKPVPNNDGTIRYTYAPYEDIMEQVQPLLVKHGFSVSFSTKYDERRIIKFCTLRHVQGHSVTNEFAVRIGSGPPKASEAQADGAAGTYAKRQALLDALNIVVETDDDARDIGATISKEQAESLRQRVRATGSNEEAFLKYAQASSYEEIGEAMYPMLDQSLKRKESTK